jgi:hypothetical protein
MPSPTAATAENVATQDPPVAKVDKMQVPKDIRQPMKRMYASQPTAKYAEIVISAGCVKVAQQSATNKPSIYPSAEKMENVDASVIKKPVPEFKLGPLAGSDPQDATRIFAKGIIDKTPILGAINRYLNRHNVTTGVDNNRLMIEYGKSF